MPHTGAPLPKLTRYRVLRYERDSPNANPRELIDSRVPCSRAQLLTRKDVELDFSIDAETARVYRQPVDTWPIFVLEVMSDDGNWERIGAFDPETYRLPRELQTPA
jgi:hypothetical protein